MSALQTWAPLVPDGSVRWLKYSFGPGTANTLAVRPSGGRWIVVSPSIDSPPHVYDELARDGEVGALVSPNAYHHRGQAAWRRRFPGAVSHAPAGAIERLRKKSPEVEYRPLDDSTTFGEHVRVVVPDGQKSPDLLMRVIADDTTIWWLGDLFSNSTRADQVWWLRLVGRLAGSGLGYRCNSKPELVYVDDRAAWLRSIREAIAAAPPAIVVPAHGDPVIDDTARRTDELLRAAS